MARDRASPDGCQKRLTETHMAKDGAHGDVAAQTWCQHYGAREHG